MKMNPANIFSSLPTDLSLEVFENIVHTSNVKIERIISKGHHSPESGWYDQDVNEWVLVLQGKAILIFENGSKCELSAGDYINISAHVRHKLAWTSPEEITIWLAIFY